MPSLGWHLSLGLFLCMSCLPALSKCSSTFCCTLSSPNTWILVSLIPHLRAFLSAQPTPMLLSYEPGGQRCLLVFTASAVRGSYNKSCLPGQSLHSLRVAANCFVSPVFLALGTMPCLVLDFMIFCCCWSIVDVQYYELQVCNREIYNFCFLKKY